MYGRVRRRLQRFRPAAGQVDARPAAQDAAVLYEAAIDAIGGATAALLLNAGWVKRRKEAVELISDAWARTKTTVHFEIPCGLKPIYSPQGDEPDRYLVPVTLLPKLPPTLMRFDFVCHDGGLTMPTRRQNGLVSYAALLWAAREALGGTPLPDNLKQELLFVAIGPPEYAGPVSEMLRTFNGRMPELSQLEELRPYLDVPAADRALVAWYAQMVHQTPGTLELVVRHDADSAALAAHHNRLADDEIAAWCLEKLATNSPILANVAAAPAGSQIVSLAYDTNFFKAADVAATRVFTAQLGWDVVPIMFSTPYATADSYHFEFVPPPGIEVLESELQDVPAEPVKGKGPSGSGTQNGVQPEPAVLLPGMSPFGGVARPEFEDVYTRGGRVHLYRHGAAVAEVVKAQLHLRAVRPGFINGAALASLAVAVALILVAALLPTIPKSDGAPELLLVFPGVLVAVVAQAGRHGMTARMLRRARGTLLISGGLAFVGAFMLVIAPVGDGWHDASQRTWAIACGVLGVVALGPAVVLAIAWTLPRRRAARGWVERSVGVVRDGVAWCCLRVAHARQRGLVISAESDGIDFGVAREVCRIAQGDLERYQDLVILPRQRSADPTRLSVRTERNPPSFGAWKRSQECEPPGKSKQVPEGRPRVEPLFLAIDARPDDEYLRQDVEQARRLARTVELIGEHADGEFELLVAWDWLPRRRRMCRLMKRVGAWAIRGEQEVVVARQEQLVAAARRGDLRFNTRYLVGRPPNAGAGTSVPANSSPGTAEPLASS